MSLVLNAQLQTPQEVLQQGFSIVQFKEVFFSSFLMNKQILSNDIQHSYRNTVQINKWPNTALSASQSVAPECAKPPGSHLITPCVTP